MNSNHELMNRFQDIYLYFFFNIVMLILLLYFLPSEQLSLKISVGIHIGTIVGLIFARHCSKLQRYHFLIVNRICQIVVLGQLLFVPQLNEKTSIYLYLVSDNQLIKLSLPSQSRRHYQIALYLTLFLCALQISNSESAYDATFSTLGVVLYMFLDINQLEPETQKATPDCSREQHNDQLLPLKAEPSQQGIKVNISALSPSPINNPYKNNSKEAIDSQDSEVDHPMEQQPNFLSKRSNQSMNFQFSRPPNGSLHRYSEEGRSSSFQVDLGLKKKSGSGSKSSLEGLRPFRVIDQDDDSVWRQRLDGIPLAIALIQKTSKFLIYKNSAFTSLFYKTLMVDERDETDFLFNKLRFKIIDQAGGATQTLHSKSNSFKRLQYRNKQTVKTPREMDSQRSNTSTMKKNKRKQPSAVRGVFEEIDSQSVLSRVYTLKQVLLRIESGELNNLVNLEDSTLEMYCSHENSIQLNLKMVVSEGDTMVIIQDYTKQNNMQKAEEQNNFKTKLINSFSHDLRTPLNSASLFLRSALMDENVSQSIRAMYILPSLGALVRQMYIINDIIDFSQINAEIFGLNYTTFSLLDLIQELTKLFHHEFTNKKLGLSFNIQQDTPLIIKSDQKRLMQVLVNLIQNAQKFSHYGYVCINIEAQANRVISFSVRDEGIGITAEKLRYLQDFLNSSNYSSQMTEDWQGFGLVVSQMLLRYLGPDDGDDLKIQSEGKDLGVVVSFKIVDFTSHVQEHQAEAPQASKDTHPQRFFSEPLLGPQQGLMITIKGQGKSKLLLADIQFNDQNDPPSNFNYDGPSQLNDSLSQIGRVNQMMINANSGIIKNISSIYELNKGLTYQQSVLLRRFSSENHKKGCQCATILSVDDEVFNQTALTLMLGCLKFEVHVAYHGKQAIEMILRKSPCSQHCVKYQLIIMDYQMPILDGLETTKRIIAMINDNEILPIPIVGLTAFTSSKDVEMCKQAGMLHVLEKPFQLKRFKEILENLQIPYN